MSSSFTEKPVKYSTYTKEYSKTYENKVSNIKIYYDSKYNDILGFAATYKVGNTTKIDKIGNNTSTYFKDITLSSGISYKLNFKDKKVYGKYAEFYFKYGDVTLKNITYRVLDGIYELFLDDAYTYFKTFPVTNSTKYKEVFIKTYINLKSVTMYYDESGNIIGFIVSSSTPEIIGSTNSTKYIPFLFTQFKVVPTVDVANNNVIGYSVGNPESNEILPSVNTIIFRVSNGIYNVEFPDLTLNTTPIIDGLALMAEGRDYLGNVLPLTSTATNKSISYITAKYTSEATSFRQMKTFRILNKIQIFYHNNSKTNIIGFGTIGDPDMYSVGYTNYTLSGNPTPYTLIDLKNGFSFKFSYYGYKVYGNYDDYVYKTKNKLTTISYLKISPMIPYSLEFNNIPIIENVKYIETPVTNSTKYNKEYNKTYDNKLNSIIINYNSNYNSISGFETEYDAIGIPTNYTKNINLTNGISYTLNSIGQKIYGNYNEYPNKFKTVNIKLVMYRVSNGIYEIAFPELFPELKKYF